MKSLTSVAGIPRPVKQQPSGWYVELDNCVLAISMRTASTSTHAHLRTLGMTAKTWRPGIAKAALRKGLYGVIRDPKERAISGLRRYMGKHQHPVTCIEKMIKSQSSNGHVMPVTSLHAFRVEKWMKFEEYVTMLHHNANPSKGIAIPEDLVFPEWFEEYFEHDYAARAAAESGIFELPESRYG